MSDKHLKERRERLRQALADRAYSEQYADSVLFETVSSQALALRRQRGMTQEQLAERIGSKQPRVSNVESPKQNPEWPNWEVSTLNRIAHALGARLEINFKSYGSLVPELGTLNSESLRIPEYRDDPIIFPLPSMPGPDANAPERTRWMQELMIPWLWEDKLDLARLYSWLRGSGLPPVGHDEEPYQWLLRGIAISGPARDHLEKRFAERLAVLLGEQPDTIMPEGGEDFLRNLYWTCAGLRRPSFLAEQLWNAYKRLKDTKLRGDIRDALQAALVQNQFGETRPLKEIWEPMVEKGRKRGLRGDEIVGYEGILVRHATVKPDVDKVLWALGTISHRWDAGHKAEFKNLLWKVPDLGVSGVYKRLLESARNWSSWAQGLVPILDDRPAENRVEISLPAAAVVVSATWPENGRLRTGIRPVGASPDSEREVEESSAGRPRRRIQLNELARRLAHMAAADSAGTGGEFQLAHQVIYAKTLAAA